MYAVLISQQRIIYQQNLNHNDDHHLHDYCLAEDMLEDEFGDASPDIDFGCDEAVDELENAVADIEVGEFGGVEVTIVRQRGEEFRQNNGREKLTLLNLVRNDEDLIAFTGIDDKLLDS
ncbi:hypothetical protein QAD02_000941 [Eretmocerus hayati]|uniref:Uncharacterized protein n=1 Tax=Eretmocerus hayati TaxID=131215 RepID=A0ACC2NF04_9HYME|nr:hypothetical protein QAD02_000941 [Eretmocerus hayati]